MGIFSDVTVGNVTFFVNASGVLMVTGTIIRPDFPPRHHDEEKFIFPQPPIKVEIKDPVKVEVKDEVKVEVKDEVKVEIKDPVKVEIKDPVKVDLKDECLKVELKDEEFKVKVHGEIREEEKFIIVSISPTEADALGIETGYYALNVDYIVAFGPIGVG
ncbi:MAG: hypothetical protein P4N59_06540 [Negativicutes bacterium]|nr:hypothetical protein [Negativicutes bacterium]